MAGRRRRQVTKQATIRDVAQRAGVSITTVSNVLNDRTDAMAGDTLQRILEVMQELDYRPNVIARSLVTRRTGTIGVIIAEVETPLFLHALSFIEPIAREAGFNLLMARASTVEDERLALGILLGKQVDALIFLSVSQYTDDDHIRNLRHLETPAVLINRATIHADFDHINWDDSSGVVSAVEHLIEAGHRRIAHLRGPLGRRSGANRLEGYRLALEKHRLEYREDYVQPGDYTMTQETWRESTLELLDLSPRPTAIVASDDIVAAVAMKTVQQAGLRVPQDVAIVGMDDQHFCSYLNPALTTVRLPVLEAGRLAVEMVLGWLAGQRTEVEHIVLPCSLVVRESCGSRNTRGQ